MTTPKQGKEVLNMDDIRLQAMVTAEVERTLHDEVPKLAERMAVRLYEKIRKRVTMNIEPSTPKKGPAAKKGKIYHLTETEEEARETWKRRPSSYRCGEGGHPPSECLFSRLMCLYCNQFGHSYDACVEKMVTKREVIQDPYFPTYDPWVNERIRYE